MSPYERELRAHNVKPPDDIPTAIGKLITRVSAVEVTCDMNTARNQVVRRELKELRAVVDNIERDLRALRLSSGGSGAGGSNVGGADRA